MHLLLSSIVLAAETAVPAVARTVPEMTKMDFGLTMIVVGMGGTLLTLWLLTLVIDFLRKALPAEPTNKS